MSLKLLQAFGAALTLAAFVGAAVLTPAQAAENVRIRGTVVGLEGSTLTVKTREGPNAMVTMKPGAKVAGVTKATVEDIKAGDFVGIASLPTAAGGDGAIEVLVFPPALKGTGEGSLSVGPQAEKLDDQCDGHQRGQGRRWANSRSFL